MRMGIFLTWRSLLYMLFGLSFLLFSWMKSGAGENFDVIVVGGGLAGLSAAMAATEQGARVLLLEKGDRLGGNSAKATSGINGIGTQAQRANNVKDSIESFVQDTLRSGRGRSDEVAVTTLAQHSGDAVDWLVKLGVDLTVLSQLGGHSAPRTHRLPPGPDGRPRPVGFTIIQKLSEEVRDKENIKIVTSAQVMQLLYSTEGVLSTIVGVAYQKKERDDPDLPPEELAYAPAVVLTTGGYAYDRSNTSLLHEFAPDLLHLPTTSGPLALGEGVRLARDIDAELVDMDQIQVHPTGLVDLQDPSQQTKFLAPEALRGSGAILVDAEGKRFANELGPRDYLSSKIFEHCQPLPNSDGQKIAYMILTESGAEKFGKGTLGFYQMKGLFQKLEGIAQASEKVGFNSDHLTQTFEEYSVASKTGQDRFGKTVFPVQTFSQDETLYVAAITPCIHYTMGGLKIDPVTAQVQQSVNGKFQPIEGLFAAGEVTGGVHGKNRLGGNSLLECVVFGRIAGYGAVLLQEAKTKIKQEL